MTAHRTFPVIKIKVQIPFAAANWKKTADVEKEEKRVVTTKTQFRGFVWNHFASPVHINCRHTSYIKVTWY